MKPLINYLLPATLLLLATFRTEAQKATPKEGYWVVESNKKTPGQATVYFYNNQHQQVYKEAVNNITLDVSKRKIRRHLNAVLNQSIAASRREKGQLLASRMQ